MLRDLVSQPNGASFVVRKDLRPFPYFPSYFLLLLWLFCVKKKKSYSEVAENLGKDKIENGDRGGMFFSFSCFSFSPKHLGGE